MSTKFKDQPVYGTPDPTKFLKDQLLIGKNDGTYASPTYGAGSVRTATIEEFLENYSLPIAYEDSILAADIKTGNTTPIEILPALPAGYVYDIISAIAKINAGATAFDDAIGEMQIMYSGSAALLTSGVGFTNTLTAFFIKMNPDILATLPQIIEGSGIEVKFSADSTVGDGTIDIYVSYRIVKL